MLTLLIEIQFSRVALYRIWGVPKLILFYFWLLFDASAKHFFPVTYFNFINSLFQTFQLASKCFVRAYVAVDGIEKFFLKF